MREKDDTTARGRNSNDGKGTARRRREGRRSSGLSPRATRVSSGNSCTPGTQSGSGSSAGSSRWPKREADAAATTQQPAARLRGISNNEIKPAAEPADEASAEGTARVRSNCGSRCRKSGASLRAARARRRQAEQSVAARSRTGAGMREVAIRRG